MDAIDKSILELLARDGRASMAELGRGVGLSRTACLARVQRLERDGVIRGYHADVRLPDAAATHAARVAIVLRDIDPNAYVRRLARAFPELEAVRLSGLDGSDPGSCRRCLLRSGGWCRDLWTRCRVVRAAESLV